MESNVLLCCVWPNEDEKFVTDELLKGIFSAYGTVAEIAIFCRKVMIKAFVEYESSRSVSIALDEVREVCLPGIGKLKVFKSTKSTIRRTGQTNLLDNSPDLNDSFTSLAERSDRNPLDQSRPSKNSNQQMTHPESFRSQGQFRLMPSMASIQSLEDIATVDPDLSLRLRHISHPDVLHFNGNGSQSDVYNSRSIGTFISGYNPSKSEQHDKDQAP